MTAIQGSERALVERIQQALHARFRFPFDPLVSEALEAADALAARLKEVEGERDEEALRVMRTENQRDEAEERAELAEAQLRVAREGLEQIAMPLDSIQPGWDVEDAEVDRAAMQRIARDTLARLDAPEQAASGSGGEGA